MIDNLKAVKSSTINAEQISGKAMDLYLKAIESMKGRVLWDMGSLVYGRWVCRGASIFFSGVPNLVPSRQQILGKTIMDPYFKAIESMKESLSQVLESLLYV